MNEQPCEDIEVRFLQHVQDFGALIAIDLDSCMITHASENISRVLEKNPQEILGKKLSDFPEKQFKAIRQLCEKHKAAHLGRKLFYSGGHEVQIHIMDKCLIVEWIFFDYRHEDIATVLNTIYFLEKQMVKQPNLDAALQLLCDEAKKVLHFDKVLVYRFLDDGSGITVAEAKEDDMEAYLQLRFPASDVPKQVRDLFLHNQLRLIHNSLSKPIPICSLKAEKPLDLSSTLIKGVAPVHQEYTLNMKIETSISQAISIQDRLWGLLCCHNKKARPFSKVDRCFLQLFSKAALLAIDFFEKSAAIDILESEQAALMHVFDAVSEAPESFLQTLIEKQEVLLKLVNAKGVGVVFEGQLKTAGMLPERDFLSPFLGWLQEQFDESGVFLSDSLPKVYPPAEAVKEQICGVLAVKISPQRQGYLFWTRPEQKSIHKWAGNPKENGINPRNSFALWEEEIQGSSEAWSLKQLKIAQDLQKHIQKSVMQILEAKRRISEEKNLQINYAIDQITEGVFILTKEQKFAWLNNWLDQYLASLQPLEGFNFYEALEMAKADLSFKERNPLTLEKRWSQKVAFENGDKERRVLLFSITPFKMEFMKEERYVGIASDITKLEETQSNLALLNRQKDDFLRMLSHDVRNPLTVILDAVDLLHEFTEKNEMNDKLVKTIKKQGENVVQMLNEFLEVVKVQSGQIEVSLAQVAFEDYFTDLVLLQEPRAKKKNISLKSEFSFGLKEGEIDKMKVKQIVDNLISNACKFSKEGSEVTVKASSSQDQLIIEVKDQGLGIPQEEQYKVFQTGETLSVKPTAGETTHGVGLSICKQIADALGAELTFQSEPSRGTIFTLKLPIHQKQKVQA